MGEDGGGCNEGMQISVIIPTKNEEKNIGNCLESLVDQTLRQAQGQGFEILVCDGGSTDKTKEIVLSFVETRNLSRAQSRDEASLQVEFFSLKPDLGYQRRFGAQNAKGKYLCFIDADMMLDSGVLESCVAAFSSDIGHLTSDSSLGAVIIPEVSFGVGFWAKVKAFEKKMYIGDDRVEAARFFLREAYEKSGGWKEGMAAGEDWDLTRRVKEAGYSVSRVNELIHHNEGRIDLGRTLKRKFYYAQKADAYMQKNVKSFKDYLLFIFRPAYFRHWPEFLKHPFLGSAFCFMKSAEFTAGFSGILFKKLVKVSYEKTK